MQSIIEYNLGLSPRRITIKPEWLYKSRYYSNKFIDNYSNLDNTKRRVDLSRKSAMLIQRSIEWMALSAQPRYTYSKKHNKTYYHKLGMITLTIPVCKSIPKAVDVYKQCLMPFLKSMKRFHGLVTYTWVREFQKNGMVHYHIITPEFIHKDTIQKVWNRLLKASNYLDDYFARHANYLPPSTNVAAVRDSEMTAHYAAKYMSKGMCTDVLDTSRSHGSSLNISQALKTKCSIYPEDYQKLHETLQIHNNQYYQHSSSEVFYQNLYFKPLATIPQISDVYNKVCRAIRDYGKQLEPSLWIIPPNVMPSPSAQEPKLINITNNYIPRQTHMCLWPSI